MSPSPPKTPNGILAWVLQLLEELEFEISKITRKNIKLAIFKAWDRWQSLPRPIRYGTYGVLVGVLVGLVLWALIPVVGFTHAGVAAKSLAAVWHSWIGNVSAGSLFAMLQSIGATASFGVAVKFVGIWAIVGAVAGAAVGAGGDEEDPGSSGAAAQSKALEKSTEKAS